MPKLALQLHSSLQVRALCGGLVGASPERPGDDVGGLDASLGEADGDAPDLLDRPADEVWCLRASRIGFFGGVGALAWWRMTASMAKASMTSETCRCQPCQERVSLWSRPSSFLAVSNRGPRPAAAGPGWEAVLDCPAVPLDLDQDLDPGPGRAPGREEGELAIGDGTADQQAPRPQAGEVVAVFSGLEVGQLQVGPVVEPWTLGAIAGREAHPRRSGQCLGDLLCRAGHQRPVAPGGEGVRAVDAQHVAFAGPPQGGLDLAHAVDAVGRTHMNGTLAA